MKKAVLFLALLVPFACYGQEKKPVGALLIETSAEAIAEDFKKDPVAAKKKYEAMPPKGVLAGAIINLKGEYSTHKDKCITFKTENGITVAVRMSTDVEIKADGLRKAVEISGARLVTFDSDKKIVLLEAESAKVMQIIGKQKP